MRNSFEVAVSRCAKNPKSFWKSIESHKKFLDEAAVKLNISSSKDWGKITTQRFNEIGGNGLLNYYNGSLFGCLRSNYREIEWKQEWFCKHPKMYWESTENQKKFLDEIALLLNIKNPDEWGKVTTQQFLELGGRSLLDYYNNSLFLCLQSIYKDTKWKREWFFKLPNSYWKSMENRKNFLDQVALQLNIKNPKDWGKVTQQSCNKFGGSGLLKYYNGSLFAAVQSIYKGIQWKKSWFKNAHHFPKNYWESLENCKKFMDDIALKSKVTLENDWRKVSLTLIRHNGGEGLIRKYSASLPSLGC